MIGVDNRTGPHPSLTARDIRRVHVLSAQGSTGPEIARVLGVSVRTVRRYLRAYLVTQTVAGHPLTFIVYPGKRPVLIDAPGSRR